MTKQRPLATVIVWGLSSSTLLTLLVIPVVYYVLAPGLPQKTPDQPREDLDEKSPALIPATI